ncbi:hypothetical protein A0H81_12844 [Grifola frondosa]|uniref:Uncharacterized protein n=1 Tax=Grifola frondosa TaxID=5627 RepID=A0A1C7LQG7_GRIFR|nr:hypothetical protein A0H81_12844 [Grifola frondosa]
MPAAIYTLVVLGYNDARSCLRSLIQRNRLRGPKIFNGTPLCVQPVVLPRDDKLSAYFEAVALSMKCAATR